jgi:hypothetical protein
MKWVVSFGKRHCSGDSETSDNLKKGKIKQRVDE